MRRTQLLRYGRELHELIREKWDLIHCWEFAYVPERAIARYAAARDFPIIPCTLCGSQPHLQRVAVRNMLRDWEGKFPGRIEAIFSSIRNVSASQLADPKLFGFAGLEQLRAPAPRARLVST